LDFVRSKGLYIVASVMLAAVFLTGFFVYGIIVLGIKPYDFLSLISGGIAATLAITLSPYVAVKLKEKQRKYPRKRRKTERNYPIYLLTNNPPDYDVARLKAQAERIDFVIRDLNKLCSECLSRKCRKCRIKREILPTLEKIEKRLRK